VAIVADFLEILIERIPLEFWFSFNAQYWYLTVKKDSCIQRAEPKMRILLTLRLVHPLAAAGFAPSALGVLIQSFRFDIRKSYRMR
jgi:hypothetical protein